MIVSAPDRADAACTLTVFLRAAAYTLDHVVLTARKAADALS